MALKPFTEINAFIEGKLSGSEVPIGRKYSYLKIFQHALTYAINRSDSKILSVRLNWWWPFFLLAEWIRSLRQRRSGLSMKEVVILDPGRSVRGPDGRQVSIYFDQIYSALGQERVSMLVNGKGKVEYCRERIDELRRASLSFPKKEIREVIRDVRMVIRRARISGSFTDYELTHLESAFHIFIEDLRFYFDLFYQSRVQSVFFISHYHNEGLIAALNLLGIRSIEVQHGLISAQDIYYVYPSSLMNLTENALFPDNQVLYGTFWENILKAGAEYRIGRTVVAGDYTSHQSGRSVHPPKEKMVLVCSQKNMSSFYVPYVRKLALMVGQHSGWRVVVKLHPLEPQPEAYRELESPVVTVLPLQERLSDWLGRAEIQISVYSTTFFDAIGSGVVNFSIQGVEPGSEYAREMVQHGVALELSEDEDPIGKWAGLDKGRLRTPGREVIYASFDPRVIQALCL